MSDLRAIVRVLVDEPDWKADAACRDVDPELFFPQRGESTAEAKAVCRRCDVQAECLAYALTNNEHFGIWGGKSERERHRIRRARLRAVGQIGPERPVAHGTTEAEYRRCIEQNGVACRPCATAATTAAAARKARALTVVEAEPA